MSQSERSSVIHRMAPEEAATVNEKRTGFELHAWQAEAIARLNDNKDVLLTAAPGAGKSMVYMAAAMLMSERHIAIVVCPPEEAGHRVKVSCRIAACVVEVQESISIKEIQNLTFNIHSGRDGPEAGSQGSFLRL